MAREQWVVTYRIESKRGVSLVEFYRGTYDECLHIWKHSSGGSDDSVRTEQPWVVSVGTLRAWEKFLADSLDDPGVEPFVVEAR